MICVADADIELLYKKKSLVLDNSELGYFRLHIKKLLKTEKIGR